MIFPPGIVNVNESQQNAEEGLDHGLEKTLRSQARILVTSDE
jgi:hypothetical protein